MTYLMCTRQLRLPSIVIAVQAWSGLVPTFSWFPEFWVHGLMAPIFRAMGVGSCPDGVLGGLGIRTLLKGTWGVLVDRLPRTPALAKCLLQQLTLMRKDAAKAHP